MATRADIQDLLVGTTLPAPLIEELLRGASNVWLLGEPAEVIAGDLALCHPPLGPAEVRATVLPTWDPGIWRLGVVAHDRSGLLAGTAGALAGHGLSILSASVNTWPSPGLALQRVVATRPEGTPPEPPDWDAVGSDLRAALGRSVRLAPRFVPRPPVEVVTRAARGDGRTVVHVRAPDRMGLLWATARWMADRGANIEVARVGSDDGMAEDTFVVTGPVDGAALAAHLSGEAARGRGGARSGAALATAPARLALHGGGAVARTAARAATGALATAADWGMRARRR